ncbi:hypothetical protein BDV25DRAFT_140161 [Aspergillus avenaceus]|uniref:Uncharacterized protein n=1 Tax=Aspergillus avenaceus TaxID=36643 RepID=A0A5N6TUR0_ASPAV|nr:hypothetical protein BDV25DRAFT_140161 [Aspergillus avenaceus]
MVKRKEARSEGSKKSRDRPSYCFCQQLLLVLYAICILAFFICGFGNRFLPVVNTLCAGWTLVSILVVLVAVSVSAKAGRHTPSDALAQYDTSLSGWGNFSFCIGLLPPAFVFSAIGMVS